MEVKCTFEEFTLQCLCSSALSGPGEVWARLMLGFLPFGMLGLHFLFPGFCGTVFQEQVLETLPEV
jgi:hypothetical protein